MSKITTIKVNDSTAEGILVDIPDSQLEILQIRCTHGMLFCGIFDKSMLEKLNFPAAVFSAPHFENMLKDKPLFLTEAAHNLGASKEMTGSELVVLFS